MHLRLILLLFLCPLSFALHGQVGLTTPGLFRGTVVDALSGEPLVAVTVINTTTQQSAYTGNDGSFAITARPGQRIAFSYVGYKSRELTVPDGGTYLPQRITLERKSYELSEYIVRPKYTPYQADSIARHSTYQRALSRYRTKSIGSPVTLLADRISKKSRQIYRFQKEFNHWEDERFIDSRYTPELVAQLTHLGGDTLAYFMNANPIPYDYVRAASDLELKMWIREHYRTWLQAGGPAKMPVLQQADTTAAPR